MASFKRIAILQPGYLPWLGFFDIMYKSDVFVVLDDVQYTVRDWRSRNRIKTAHGIKWLTVPVKSKGARNKLIREVEVDNDQNWQKVHINTIKSFYKKSAYFDEILPLFKNAINHPMRRLIDVDMEFILKFRNYMGIKSNLIYSSDIPSKETKDMKLLYICKEMGASHYISGNAAKAYLKEEMFTRENIKIEWHDYNHPYYNQLWLKEFGFISHLSVLDLLFNHGPASREILCGQKVIPAPDPVPVTHANDAGKTA